MKIVFVLLTMLMIPGFAAELTPHPNPHPAPAFRLQDIQGQTHALSDYRGQVLVVNFWASWCSPCVKEMPSLQRAWEQWRQDGIQVLAINMGESPAAIKDFMARYSLDFPLLMDHDIAAATEWKVKGLPVTYVVDRDGRMALRVIGERKWDDPAILEQVRALNKARPTIPAATITLLNHK